MSTYVNYESTSADNDARSSDPNSSFFIPTGNLLTVPHLLQRISSKSAHGFFPFLLGLRMASTLVLPGIKRASQRLHMECFTAGDKRTTDFRDTPRRCINRRVDSMEFCDVFEVLFSVAVALSVEFWLLAVARYDAAW